MSRFMRQRYSLFDAYTPGEQPQDRQYLKLNTNESPYPPSPGVLRAVDRAAIQDQRLYSDPECQTLRAALADINGVAPENLLCGNGSDELLSFAFMAWGERGAAFADLSYGLYQVLADLHDVKARRIPLREDYCIDDRDYTGLTGMICIANPNAPTGIALLPRQLHLIAEQNPDQVLVVDEAYVAFGAASCLPLIRERDNIVVIRTFSKSHSLAGARLGYAVGPPALIRDIQKVKNAINPYNVSRLTQLMGLAALAEEGYYQDNCRQIVRQREQSRDALQRLGFEVLPSQANFLFARHRDFGGAALYLALKKRGILVRHFDGPRSRDFIRITIGTGDQMAQLIQALSQITGGAAS